jgi:hypothetical protein
MTSPTRQAQHQFRQAHNNLRNVVAQTNDQAPAIADGLREGLVALTLGMDQLAVGLRATYQLIEKMQADIELLKRPRLGP